MHQQQFHLNADCVIDDFDNAIIREAAGQSGVDEACKVTVEPFIMANEFVAEAEARHESALFEPEFGTERSQEENAFFNSGKCNDPFGKAGIGRITPFKSPIGLAVSAWNCFDGAEKVQFFGWVYDVRVDEK